MFLLVEGEEHVMRIIVKTLLILSEDNLKVAVYLSTPTDFVFKDEKDNEKIWSQVTVFNNCVAR